MKNAVVLFAPSVDAALTNMIDYVETDDLPAVLNFLEELQTRLVHTLSTHPEGGAPFQGTVRMFAIRGYTFLYEYHGEANEVHVLDMIAPGQNWR